jgi:F420-dependent oxidoreductase-like protein
MRLGVVVGVGGEGERTFDGLTARAAQIEAAGFAAMWMGTAFGLDALTALAVAGRATSRIEVATAVMPTYPRHPAVMAQQARTTQAALDGRFTLGIGLSHPAMMNEGLGLDTTRPVSHLREYVMAMAPLLAGARSTFAGEHYSLDVGLDIDAEPVPLLVAALGSSMLRVAGRLTDGTITAWVGPRTLESHIVPTIARAAEEAERPAPRVAAIFPVALVSDRDATRQELAERWQWYGSLPSFQAMFDREGVDGPADIALVGDERQLDAELDRLESIGVTDLAANLTLADSESSARTFDYLASRVAR